MTILDRSYWPADTSVPVLDLTVGEVLRNAARSAPEKLAIASVAPDREDRLWTYAEFLDDAERAAAWLLDRFAPGDHIAIWAPNVPEWLILQYGAALSGLVLVTVNPALRAAELTYALQRARCVGLFSVSSFRGTDMAAIVSDVLPDVPEVRESVDVAGWLDDVRRTAKRATLPTVSPGGPTQIQFTSGTTGNPKPAVLRHRAMVTNAAYVRERCGATPGATFATPLPLFHTAGCGLAAMGSFHDRATLVLAEVFDPATILRAIDSYQAEVLAGVPLMLYGVLAHPEREQYGLRSLRVVMSGGDAVPAALVDGWAQVGDGVAASAVYGQTELSPIICQTSPRGDREIALHTAGLPLPNVEVAILDPESGQIAPIGVVGEICARGYQVMIEYLDMPEATARTIDTDGWLHTGDLGSIDQHGHVTVTGRLKDMIIRGGENIYPREIEEALVTHHAVTNAAVIGRSDEQWGEQVIAVVQVDPAAGSVTSSELHDYLRGLMAPHKTPREWYVTTEFPTNAMGKLQKFRLRDRIEEGGLRRL